MRPLVEVYGVATGMLQFEKQNEDALRTMLNGLGARDAVLNYQQIHGLLFAMANSPEPIAASEWFELIWLSDDPQFDDPGEAKTFYRLLLSLFRAIDGDVQAARYRPGVIGRENCSVEDLCDWCDGFLMGHHYLEDIWTVALDDLNDDQLYEQVDEALNWAVAFIDGAVLDSEVDEADDRFLAAHLHFQQLLENYRTVRSRLGESEFHLSVEKVFAEMQPVERDELCPCGSGHLFAQCCLH
jgi:yecA family protein